MERRKRIDGQVGQLFGLLSEFCNRGFNWSELKGVEKSEADLFLIPSYPGIFDSCQMDDVWPELLEKHRDSILRKNGFDHIIIMSQTLERGHTCLYDSLSKVNDSAVRDALPNMLKLTCMLNKFFFHRN